MKIIFFLLLLCLILPSAACSQPETSLTPADNAGETVSESIVPERLMPDLPQRDFEGADFVILGYYVSEGHIHNMFEFYTEAMNGEVLNDEIFSRNLTIEEKYNIKISQTGNTTPSASLLKAVLADEFTYSINVDRVEILSQYAPKSCFYSMNDIPYMDLSRPWWDQNAQNGFSIGGKLYFCTSDYLLFDKERIYAIFFNKDMMNAYHIDDLYDTVEKGEWTVEKFKTAAAAAASDLNGDGAIAFLDDQFGVVMGSYDCFYSFIYGMGNRISSKDSGDLPVLSLYNDKTAECIDILMTTLCNDSVTIYGEIATDNWKTAVSPQYIFEEGRGMFYEEMLQVATMLDTDVDYGIIPLPKYNETQEKYLTATQYIMGTCISVPVNSPDIEMTGILLEAFSAESMYTTLPVFIETVIKTKKAPDERAPHMIDLLFDGIVYDVAAAFNWGGLQTLIANTIPKNGENTFSSAYASLETKAIEQMQKTVDLYLAIQS